MRFNDLLRTILANGGEGTAAVVTRWRQCIDILAQYDASGARAANALASENRASILAILAEMIGRVPVEQRIASVAELGPRLRSPALVRLLAQDHPSLVSVMMANARLSDADWATIIPDLGPLARSVLRRRPDLGPAAQSVLAQFGPVDMTLPLRIPAETLSLVDAIAEQGPPAPKPEWPIEEPSQIGLIVAQIERFKEAKAAGRGAVSAVFDEGEISPPAAPAVEEFTFEADVTGTLTLVAGAPRSAAVGLSIGAPALDSRHGADGMALGAFRRRAAFEDARFAIGEGALAGEWRMSAEPRFDRASGRFFGYVGSARRERPGEALVRAVASEAGSGWAGLSASSTRQLIHELRTPLNAIQGYAEMIEAQLVGPVPHHYREMASAILADARALITTFDDLDLASRIERGEHRHQSEPVDLAALLRRVVAGFEQAEEQPLVQVEAEPELPMIGGDPAEIERMLGHLVRAGCAALSADERLFVRLDWDRSRASVNLAVRRPAMLRQLGERELLDHGYLVDQKLRDGPPLGLAFTLKLVRGIASHLGGVFTIGADAFQLALPATSVVGEQESLP
jgi:signal transduction histidine kinase